MVFMKGSVYVSISVFEPNQEGEPYYVWFKILRQRLA
jgi:hypothetical protein